MMKIKKYILRKRTDEIAHFLIGAILERKIGRRILKSKIVECEAYFGENDPASWARFGKRKDNFLMWDEPGKILVKNVHKYFMFNIVTGKKGEAGAVLIRAIEPLNFSKRTNGPGLLTVALEIDKSLNGEHILDCEKLRIVGKENPGRIQRSFRIGVKSDLPQKYRFYDPFSKWVSKR